MEPMAGPRRRRLAGRLANDVWGRRRAKARRIRGPVAAGLRKRKPGQDRQCGGQAAPARRVRGGSGYVLRRPTRRARDDRRELGPRMRASRSSRKDLARSRRRHLGGAGPETALHPLEGHGLGGLRSRRAIDRGVQHGRPRRALAPDAIRNPRQRLRAWLRPPQNAFVQSYGINALDASLLLLPMVGFLPPDDPRVHGTIAAIERKLMQNGFVLRYDTGSGTDGLPPGEGAFLACSFWLADNYALIGRTDEARDCSSACSRCATRSGCWPRNTIRSGSASSAISPKLLSPRPYQYGAQSHERDRAGEDAREPLHGFAPRRMNRWVRRLDRSAWPDGAVGAFMKPCEDRRGRSSV